MTDQRQARVIKRYANRKLYDMSESCYITHDEIASLVKQGEEVKIIDNRTKEDLTTLTLTQILMKEEKRQRKTLPLSTLRGILQSGGDFIQRRIAQPVTTLRDEAEENIRKVFGKPGGEDGEEEEHLEFEPIPETLDPLDPQPVRPKGAEAVREWLDSTQRAYENLQKTLEDRWNLIFHSIGQFDANQQRIAELEKRVVELESHLGLGQNEEAP